MAMPGGGGMLENDEMEQAEEISQELLGNQNLDSAEYEPFDISLTATHSYLSEEGMTEVPGRSVLESGWVGSVPCLSHGDCVFPGETVPFILVHDADQMVMREAIRTNKLFCLLFLNEGGKVLSGYGVICEVLERGRATREVLAQGVGGDVVKARASHRVRLTAEGRRRAGAGVLERMQMLEVVVLAERGAEDPLAAARLPSLSALRASRPRTARALDAALTPWPLYVYDMFDFRRLAAIVKDFFLHLGFEQLPEDEVSLSFWASSNLCLPIRDRLALFSVDNALLRLRMAVAHFSRHNTLYCIHCDSDIADMGDVVKMSAEGLTCNYTNYVGYMHDVLTVSAVRHVRAQGPASAQFTWFPGYVWSVLLCAACGAHVGWRYDAAAGRRALAPRRFFGLCRNHVAARRHAAR